VRQSNTLTLMGKEYDTPTLRPPCAEPYRGCRVARPGFGFPDRHSKARASLGAKGKAALWGGLVSQEQTRAV
jgi:hypothetical protein